MTRGEYVVRSQAAALPNPVTATFSVNGRVTIPKAIRDVLNLTADAPLNYTLLSNDTVAIRAQP